MLASIVLMLYLSYLLLSLSAMNQIKSIYVAKPEFLPELCREVGQDQDVFDDLVFSRDKSKAVCFAQDVWLEPQIVTFQSISQAVKLLSEANRFWYLHPISHVRRSRLIEAQLRKCPDLTRPFPIDRELPLIGGFGLIDQNTLVYSVSRSKKWPDGKCFFIEDKINPPNRAYLKLWEALTLLDKYPKPWETVLDLGASPGGWTYVMQSFGAMVTAVDKAPLDPKISSLSGVNFLKQSAFALDPAGVNETFDWVLSDVACYPERAYSLIMKWINSGKAKQMIFTIKLQGETDFSMLEKIKEIPNSRLINLFYNKHEATFFYPAEGC
jgi:23S rRNA (cytidine2498-2'-O)-methyltransferase